MTSYHAVMLDETGCEFGVDLEAADKTEAYDILQEDYPESRCIEIMSHSETLERDYYYYKHCMEMDDY